MISPARWRSRRTVGLLQTSHGDGLRAYYFSFAAAAWFISPLAFLLATAGFIYVLYQREFRSDVLAVLNS